MRERLPSRASSSGDRYRSRSCSANSGACTSRAGLSAMRPCRTAEVNTALSMRSVACGYSGATADNSPRPRPVSVSLVDCRLAVDDIGKPAPHIDRVHRPNSRISQVRGGGCGCRCGSIHRQRARSLLSALRPDTKCQPAITTSRDSRAGLCGIPISRWVLASAYRRKYIDGLPACLLCLHQRVLAERDLSGATLTLPLDHKRLAARALEAAHAEPGELVVP